jgi:hypothetical protein
MKQRLLKQTKVFSIVGIVHPSTTQKNPAWKIESAAIRIPAEPSNKTKNITVDAYLHLWQSLGISSSESSRKYFTYVSKIKR